MTARKVTFLTILIASCVTILINLGIWSQFKHKENPPPQYNLFKEIEESGVIRAAYLVGAPLFMIDPNTGKKSGIFYEIVDTLAKRMHLRVEWVQEVGYGEMIQGLKDRRYDIVGCGVWINSDRALGADFTVPVYYDAVYAYSRYGDYRFKSDISILDSPVYTISTMDGELGASIAQKDFPNAKTLPLPQNSDFSQLILNVISGKADVVFLASAPARSYQAKNPNKIESFIPDNPLRIFPVAIMLPQGQYIFRQVLDFTLTEMLNSGEINTILKKYEEVPNSFLRIAAPFEK